MGKIKFILIGMLLIMLGFTGISWAVPEMINVQGQLTDSGEPVTVSSLIAFEIYTTLTEGSPVWSSLPFTVEPDENGIFNVIVDGTHTFSGTFPDFMRDEYYLQVILVRDGTDTPLDPRQRLVTSPFAITAKNLTGGKVNASGEPAVRGTNSSETSLYGELGSTNCGVYGKANGEERTGVRGANFILRFGEPPLYYGKGVEGIGGIGVYGSGAEEGVYGRYKEGTAEKSYGYLGSRYYGAYGRYNDGTMDLTLGWLGSSTTGVYGQFYKNESGTRVAGPTGKLGTNKYGVYGHSSESDGAAVYASGGSNTHGVVGLATAASMPTVTNKYGGLFSNYMSGRALGAVGGIYSTGTFHGSSTLDIAEWIKTTDPSVSAGDVVIIDRGSGKAVTRSKQASDTLVAGIISTDPNYLAGNIVENDEVLDAEEIEARGYRMLALAGQVPCNVSAENGPVNIGDLLTTSNTPGYAMKATDPKVGTVIGKALEPLSSGRGKILVLITLQ